VSEPKRVQRQRKGWRMPEGAVYVGRPGVFGNPAVIECDRSIANTVNPWHLWAGDVGPGLGWSVTKAEATARAVRFYREWLTRTKGGRITNRLGDTTAAYMAQYDEIWKRMDELAGHDLACWCPLDQPCHADVLLELANASRTTPAAVVVSGNESEER
jgi:hypothetical protein